MTDDFRLFDDLPERVWRSPEAQLVKTLTDFDNANGKMNGPIAVLGNMREHLPSDINRIAEGLKMILDFTKSFDRNGSRESLNAAFAAGNLEAVKQIAQFGGETANSWTLREIAKLETLKRQQRHLEKIGQQLSACQTLFSAMFAVTVGAEVGGDSSGMVLNLFDKPVPSGGPHAKHIDNETPIFTVILGIQKTLQEMGLAIAAIPDTDFPEKIKGSSPSELGKELQQVSASPVVQRINSQTDEVARQLGLLI
jgi:hypothetical protein